MKKGKLLRSALLASAAVLISTGGGVILSSCNVGSTESNSGGEVKDNVQAYATVQGVVKDDTGKPVAGAKVYVGDKETTTNDAGYYVFNKVPVTQVLGEDGVTTSYDDIVVVIKSPEGSNLAETIMVTAQPNAQQFDSNISNDGTAVSNPNTIVVNNLLAQARTAILPHKAASVNAVLRNEATGEPITNAIVKLSAGKTPGCETAGCQIQVDPVVVTTDENGAISASGLLNGTEYNIEVSGYNVTPSSFNTPDYQGEGHDYTLVLGNIEASPILASDTITPKIVVNPARIDGVIRFLGSSPYSNGLLVLAPGVNGKDKPIPVKFTEKMDTSMALTPNESVVIYDTTAKQVVNIDSLSWDTDGTTLLITTTNPIPEAHDFYVRLRGYEFKDLAGNSLVVESSNLDDIISTTSVSDDFVDQAIGNKKDYVGIQYEVYHPTTALVEPVTDLVQLDVPGADSNTADDDPTPFYEVDNTFLNYKGFYSVDEDDTDGVITALNDPSITFSTDDKICELGNRLNGNINSISCYINNATKLAFTPVSGVNTYNVYKGNTLLTTTPLDVSTLTSDFQPVGTDLYARLNGGKVELGVENVEVGDEISVVSLNGFGDEATASNVILEDTVPAFTVVQDTPVPQNVDVFGGAPSGGAGGDLVDLGTSAGGTGLPILYARADMYAKKASEIGDWTPLAGSDNFYDEETFNSFISPSRTIGAWFSEPLQSVSVKLLEGATDQTASLLDGTPTYIGLVSGYPLAAFKIKDLLKLQNLTRISFAGSTDNQGNVSGEEADLVVKDKMPPMVKKAYADTTDPTKLVVEFTEDVQLFDYDNAGNPIGVNNIIWIGGFTFSTDSSGNVSLFPATAVNWYTDEYGRTLDPTKTTITATVNGNKLEIQVTGKDASNNDVNTDKFWEELINARNKNTAGDYYYANGSIYIRDLPDTKGNDWLNNNDSFITPPNFVSEDTLAPKVAKGSNSINNLTPALQLDITDGTAPHNMNDGILPDAPGNDGNWYVGDNTGGEVYNLRIHFRESLADMNNDGNVDKNDLALMGMGASFIAGGGHYTFPAQDYGNNGDGAKIDVINDSTIEIHFDLRGGQTVAAGDSIQITNVKDDAGNTTNFTITLRNAGEGIDVSEDAYKF